MSKPSSRRAFLPFCVHSRTRLVLTCTCTVHLRAAAVVFQLDCTGPSPFAAHIGARVRTRALTAAQIRTLLALLMYHGNRTSYVILCRTGSMDGTAHVGGTLTGWQAEMC